MLLATTLLPGAALAADGDDNVAVVQIVAPDRAAIQRVADAGVDIQSVRGTTIVAATTGRQRQPLGAAGYQIERLLVPAESYDATCFLGYTAMVAYLKQLSQQHPGLLTLSDFGDGWEKAHGRPGADRDLWAVRLAGTAPGPKPKVIIVAATHAREIATTQLALDLITRLVGGYGSDADTTWLLDHRELWVVPMFNPDGHARAERGQSWRKNADPGSQTCSGSPPDNIGVDLNRNFDAFWGDPRGASPYPCDATYRGSAAFSEPETQAMRDLVSGPQSMARNPALFVTLHSYGGYVLYPYGLSDKPVPDLAGLDRVGQQATLFNGYTAGRSFDPNLLGYETSGSEIDWVYATQGVPSFTYEVGTDGFFPACGSYQKLRADNLPSLLYLAKLADAAPQQAYETARAPVVTKLSLTTSASQGSVSVTLGQKATGGVGGVELFIDQVGAPGRGAFVPSSGGTTSLAGSFALSGLTPGRHVLYVVPQDGAGHRGPPSAAAFLTGLNQRARLPVAAKGRS